jgi:hypothetical protein
VAVEVEAADDLLRVRISDGVGGDLARGSGLVGMKDRVEALGGQITLRASRERARRWRDRDHRAFIRCERWSRTSTAGVLRRLRRAAIHQHLSTSFVRC